MSAWVCGFCGEQVSPMSEDDEKVVGKAMEDHLLQEHLREGLDPDEED